MKAPYKAIEYIIENYLRTKKSLLMKEAMARGIDSGVAQEREAYAHPEYEELLRGLQEATIREETLKYMLIAAQMKADIWRSEQASERLGIKTTE